MKCLGFFTGAETEKKYIYLGKADSCLDLQGIEWQRHTIKEKNTEQVKLTKFLGIRIDERMTWKTHISYITNKISKLSGVIAKL